MMHYINSSMNMIHSLTILMFLLVIICFLFFIFKSNTMSRDIKEIDVLRKPLSNKDTNKKERENLKNTR